MHRMGIWILVFVAGATCCNSAFAQRDGRDWRDGRDSNRDGDWRRQRWDWSRDRYRDYENRRRPDFVFGRKSYTERLSSDLYQQTNSICWEMYRFYQENRGYRATYAEMYEVREGALRISELARGSYHRSRHNDDDIERDLYNLDKLFHHIEDDIARWRPNSREAYRGGDLHAKMDVCENTLHDLMEDYGIKQHAHDDDRDHVRRNRSYE